MVTGWGLNVSMSSWHLIAASYWKMEWNGMENDLIRPDLMCELVLMLIWKLLFYWRRWILKVRNRLLMSSFAKMQTTPSSLVISLATPVLQILLVISSNHGHSSKFQASRVRPSTLPKSPSALLGIHSSTTLVALSHASISAFLPSCLWKDLHGL